MPRKPKGAIRRSQLITTYGIGSIIAVEDESFMVAGIDRWNPGLPDLHEPRLERQLHVSGFRIPPASEDGSDIPVVRFPTWAHCPSCKRLDEHSRLTSLYNNKCNACGVALIPSRFIICCVNGHADDFPYFNWIHAGSPRAEGDHRMSIESAGDSASLSDIIVKCTCRKIATMENAFSKNAMKGVKQCAGRRPWLSEPDASCDQVPRTLQRGASNVWFSFMYSAISIPPWSEGAFLVLNKHWEVLRHVRDQISLRGVIEGMRLAEGTVFSANDLVAAVIDRQAAEAVDDDSLSRSLKREEHAALLHGRPEQSIDQQFVCVPAEEIPDTLSKLIDCVMLVKKLREVRVLESFSRVIPPDPSQPVLRPPLFDTHPGWLPAIEVNGEGIFMSLAESALKRWERTDSVVKRVSQINDNYRARFAVHGGLPDREITPRFMLVHSLAHAIIDQWALDSGYPASALRERLYVDGDMAGFLVYTATSDSAGSLGGVIAEAEPDRLEASYRDLTARTAWCSADPLCIESGPNGVDALNLAACHSCILLPESSCEEMNMLLDRALLVGLPSTPEVGFLRLSETEI